MQCFCLYLLTAEIHSSWWNTRFTWAHSPSYSVSLMPHVLPSLALQCRCAEPALRLTLLSNAPYLAEDIQQYAFVLLSSISASIATIYLCVLRVSFLTPLILPDLFTNQFCVSGSCLYPAYTRHLNAQSHCWNPLNLSSKTELQKPEW